MWNPELRNDKMSNEEVFFWGGAYPITWATLTYLPAHVKMGCKFVRPSHFRYWLTWWLALSGFSAGKPAKQNQFALLLQYLPVLATCPMALKLMNALEYYSETAFHQLLKKRQDAVF